MILSVLFPVFWFGLNSSWCLTNIAYSMFCNKCVQSKIDSLLSIIKYALKSFLHKFGIGYMNLIIFISSTTGRCVETPVLTICFQFCHLKFYVVVYLDVLCTIAYETCS